MVAKCKSLMFPVTLECTSKFLIKFSDKEGVKLCRDLNTLYTSTASLRYNWSSTLNNLSSFKAGEK